MDHRCCFHLLSVHAVLLLLSRSHHLAQLIFLGEFTGEGTQVLDQIVARRDDGVLGSDFTIGLDTKLELGDQRVRHLSESVSIIQILAKETSIYPRTLYPAKRTWWLCKRRERSKLPKVWSSLLKVKMADEGIPEQVNHISTLFFKQSKKEPTGINLDFNLVLARTKDKGFVSMKQDSISNLS